MLDTAFEMTSFNMKKWIVSDLPKIGVMKDT